MEKPVTQQDQTPEVSLQLYVSGMSPRSILAIKNIRNICDAHLKDGYSLEIIDLYKFPEAAGLNKIIFSPSLIRQKPLPKKTIIGTFSDTQKVIKVLELSEY